MPRNPLNGWKIDPGLHKVRDGCMAQGVPNDLWPAEENDAKGKCRSLGMPWQRGCVVHGALVKANFAADWNMSVLVRDNCGLLLDRRMELGLLAPKREELKDALRDAIAKAAESMKLFTKTYTQGLYQRRHELPALFHDMGRQRLEDMAQELLNSGGMVQCRMKPSEAAPGKWLDIPGGSVARQSVEFTKADLAKRKAESDGETGEDSKLRIEESDESNMDEAA